MAKSKIFRFHHTDDKFFPTRPERLRMLTDQMQEDTYWKVEISEWKEDRTLLQNNAFHGPILRAVMEETGYEHWQAKAEMKRMFAPKRTYIDQDGNVQEEARGTSSFNVEEFREFIEQILRWMAEFFQRAVDIDPRLRTSGHQPRIPDGPEHHPQWT